MLIQVSELLFALCKVALEMNSAAQSEPSTGAWIVQHGRRLRSDPMGN
jgi:hypothetical protein